MFCGVDIRGSRPSHETWIHGGRGTCGRLSDRLFHRQDSELIVESLKYASPSVLTLPPASVSGF